jgi:hypothetical protein
MYLFLTIFNRPVLFYCNKTMCKLSYSFSPLSAAVSVWAITVFRAMASIDLKSSFFKRIYLLDTEPLTILSCTLNATWNRASR